MTLEQLEELKKIANEDLKLDSDNIEKKTLQLSTIYQRYLEIYIKEIRQLKKLSLDKDKLYGELYKHYKFVDDYKWDTKSEIDSMVKSDDKYYKMALENSNQEAVVSYLEQLLSNIKSVGYSIKNYVDFAKLKQGMF
jgi:hypothetical protein